MKALRFLASILLVWAVVAVLAMITTWMVPRTPLGLLLSFTVVPVIYIIMHGFTELTMGSDSLKRFNESVEQRTRGAKISGLRILVLLAQILLFCAVAAGLFLAITRALDLDRAAFDAFLERHFWP